MDEMLMDGALLTVVIAWFGNCFFSENFSLKFAFEPVARPTVNN